MSDLATVFASDHGAGVQMAFHHLDGAALLVAARLAWGWPLAVVAVVVAAWAVRHVAQRAGNDSGPTGHGKPFATPSTDRPNWSASPDERSCVMYEDEELMELGERVAEDGVHRHEGAVQRLAAAVAPDLPGTASVLRDSTAPSVLRERAFSVAADAMERSWAGGPAASVRSTGRAEEPQELWLDSRGQLVG